MKKVFYSLVSKICGIMNQCISLSRTVYAEDRKADGTGKWTSLISQLATFTGSLPPDLEAQLGGKQPMHHQQAIFTLCPS